MGKLTKRHFWEWFKRNNKEYAELNKKTKKETTYLMNELNAHLRAYYKFLAFSISLEENSISVLTISVRGKSRHFKKAQAFVDTAPEITGWKMIALDEPMPMTFLLEELMMKSGIHPEEFYCSLENDDPDYADIIVYHPLCTVENKALLYRLAYGAIYNLLGEWSFGMNVQYLDIANLSNTDPAAVFKLQELPGMMSSFKSSLLVDERGNLLSLY